MLANQLYLSNLSNFPSFDQNSLHTPLMQQRIKLLKKSQAIPKKFLGTIVMHILNNNKVDLRHAFLRWHSKRNQEAPKLAIDLILCNNKVCRESFLYRLKNICRVQIEQQHKKVKIVNQIKESQQSLNSSNKIETQSYINQSQESINNHFQTISQRNIQQLNDKPLQLNDLVNIVPVTVEDMPQSLETIQQQKAVTMIQYSICQSQKQFNIVDKRIQNIQQNCNKLSIRVLMKLLKKYEAKTQLRNQKWFFKIMLK